MVSRTSVGFIITDSYTKKHRVMTVEEYRSGSVRSPNLDISVAAAILEKEPDAVARLWSYVKEHGTPSEPCPTCGRSGA